MTKYEVTEFGTIARTNEDGSLTYIPKDESNSDYQAYLAANSTPSVSSDPLATADAVSPTSLATSVDLPN